MGLLQYTPNPVEDKANTQTYWEFRGEHPTMKKKWAKQYHRQESLQKEQDFVDRENARNAFYGLMGNIVNQPNVNDHSGIQDQFSYMDQSDIYGNNPAPKDYRYKDTDMTYQTQEMLKTAGFANPADFYNYKAQMEELQRSLKVPTVGDYFRGMPAAQQQALLGSQNQLSVNPLTNMYQGANTPEAQQMQNQANGFIQNLANMYTNVAPAAPANVGQPNAPAYQLPNVPGLVSQPAAPTPNPSDKKLLGLLNLYK